MRQDIMVFLDAVASAGPCKQSAPRSTPTPHPSSDHEMVAKFTSVLSQEIGWEERS